MPRFQKHIFVCTNVRAGTDPRGCCSAKGSADVRARFKALLKERGLASRVRANAAGCLDACARGVTVVIYPEAIWYGGVTVADVEEILEKHVLGGQVVERLLMRSFSRDAGPVLPLDPAPAPAALGPQAPPQKTE